MPPEATPAAESKMEALLNAEAILGQSLSPEPPSPQDQTALVGANAVDANETFGALDKLFETEKAEGDAEPEAQEAPEAKEEAKPEAREEAKPEAKAEPKPEESLLPKSEATPEAKPAAGEPDDALSKIELPPHTKPKTAEAFANVKTHARQLLAEKEKALAELQAKVTTLEQDVQGRPAPEAAKELEELRSWRKSFDIERDPSFTEQFDGKVKACESAVMAKLKEIGTRPEDLEAIEKLGGVQKVDWDPILEKLHGATRRFIEAKLVQIDETNSGRAQALEKAKADSTAFLAQRQAQEEQLVQKVAQAQAAQFPWLKPVQAGGDITPEKAAEHNKLAGEFGALLNTFLKDRSPAKFAELAVGTVIAHRFNADLRAQDIALKAAVESKATVEKELAAVKEELAKIKNAGRINRDEKRTGAGASATVEKSTFGMTTDEALQALYNEVTAR